MTMHHPIRKSYRRGFTLVEMLVVMAMIAVLAMLLLMFTANAKKAARKTRAIGQMREIGVGVAIWAGEKNNGEPMYFRDGTGDSSSEATPALAVADRAVCAGNPAILLYDKVNPENGYVTNHTTFFSPLHIWNVPRKEDYDPSTASPKNLWGTFMWVYPSVPADDRTARQKSIMRSSSYVTVSREAYNNVLMFDDYSTAKAYYPKLYFALFRDGSVRQVVENGNIWGWFSGK